MKTNRDHCHGSVQSIFKYGRVICVNRKGHRVLHDLVSWFSTAVSGVYAGNGTYIDRLYELYQHQVYI